MSEPQTIGLIAGQGRLPFMVAQGARRAGLRVVCVGFRDQADPLLAEEVDVFKWVSVARPGSWIKHLRREGVSDSIMVGRVAKASIYTPFRIIQYMPDWRAIRVWYGRLGNKDKRNDTLLGALADELANGGIILMDSTKYIPENMAQPGILTKGRPSDSVIKDIEFGWSIVKRMGDLDIGQAIAVKEQEVIAVEAIEGTNKMINRAGELCRAGGWTLIKTGKPSQDMRFDVPTIGPDTIEKLKANGARCLAIEAGKTIIVDLEQTIALADKSKITIVGVDPDKYK